MSLKDAVPVITSGLLPGDIIWKINNKTPKDEAELVKSFSSAMRICRRAVLELTRQDVHVTTEIVVYPRNKPR